MISIGRTSDDKTVEKYELKISDDTVIEVESISRADWDGMADPCPECQGTEFDHIRYEGGHYGRYQGAVVERTDYWYQKGGLYTACKDCEEVMYKNPAYDVLEAYEADLFGEP